MRIAEIRVHQIQLPLTKPYRVSFRTYTALEPFIVEMPSWAEACIGRLFLTRAGDMNGFLKPKRDCSNNRWSSTAAQWFSRPASGRKLIETC